MNRENLPAPNKNLIECPKCGARGGCEKHGVSATGIDLRRRAVERRMAEKGW